MYRYFYILLLSLLFLNCKSISGYEQEENDLNELEKWSILQGELGIKTFEKEGDTSMTDKEVKILWKKIRKILPNSILERYITELEFISDGKSETLAAVKPGDGTNQNWTFGIDPEDVPTGDFKENKDFLHTLIHEFGHVLTLNSTQVEPSDLEYQENNERYLTIEGLAKKNSYINLFVQEFWYKNNRMEQWDKIQDIRNEDKKLDRLYDFYLSNRRAFFTDYAAESPEEDLAESWYFFVVNEKPTGQQEKDRKLLFFYQFEELKEIRAEISANIK